MGYKTPTELLVAATALPAAIEAKLPVGAPKLSETLVDIAGKLPVVPEFPVELPDLPAVPEFPEMPTLPGGAELRRRVVTGVEVRPVVRELAAKEVAGGYRPIAENKVAIAGGGYRTIT